MKKHTLTRLMILAFAFVIATTLFAVTAFADSEAVTVSAESGTVSPGGTITVTVYVKANAVNSMSLVPDYNKDKLTYDGEGILPTELTSKCSMSGVESVNKTATFPFNSPQDIDCVAYTFTLKVNETVTVGETLSISVIAVVNKQLKTVTAASVEVVCKDTDHDWSEADCLNAKTCSICGLAEGTALGHKWQNATCQAPKTCERCHITDGEVGNHSYTTKVKDEYIKSAADCENEAVYYKSCRYCGLKGNDTFTSGNKLGHTGGTATCTQQAVCTRCNQGYGDWGHNFVEVAAEEYLVSEASCISKALYVKSCDVCFERGTETFEVGDYEPHTPVTEWSNDDDKHWKVCEKCDIHIDEVAHAWDNGVETTPATTGKAGEKTYTCSVCSDTKVESIPKLTPEIKEEEKDEDKKDEDKKEGPNLVLVIGAAAVAVAVVFAVVVVIVKKKPAKAAVAEAAEEIAEAAAEEVAEETSEEAAEEETEEISEETAEETSEGTDNE